MIARRQFLINGLLSTGAWLLADPLARRIQRLATEQNRPHLIELDRPSVHFYANRQEEDSYLLTLGTSVFDDCPQSLTWGELFEVKGVNPRNRKQLLEYANVWDLRDPETGKIRLPDENDDVPWGIFRDYLYDDYLVKDSAAAQAYHYLAELDLGPLPADEKTQSLGRLEFIDGPCPGNNSTMVLARSAATLSCLQQRLLALNIEADISVV